MGSNASQPFAGTQIGNNQTSFAGQVLFSNGLPVIISSAGSLSPTPTNPFARNYTFATTETDFLTGGSQQVTNIRLESDVTTAQAAGNIAAYDVVKYLSTGKISPASYNDTSETMIGIVIEGAANGEMATVVLQGVITNEQWNWPTVGAELYVDQNGGLTSTDPNVANPILFPRSKVPVARVLNSKQIIFMQGLGKVQPRGLQNVVEDLSPQLGSNLDVNGFTVTSVANGDIALTPDGTGSVIIDGQAFPEPGDPGQLLAVGSSSSELIWFSLGSPISLGILEVVEDTSPQLGGDLDVNGQSIVSVSNGDIAITPDGTGNVILDGQYFPQTTGTAGQILSVGSPTTQLVWMSLGSPVSFIANVVEDTSPQLGGDLDVNGQSIIATTGNIVLNPVDGAVVLNFENAPSLATDLFGIIVYGQEVAPGLPSNGAPQEAFVTFYNQNEDLVGELGWDGDPILRLSNYVESGNIEIWGTSAGVGGFQEMLQLNPDAGHASYYNGTLILQLEDGQLNLTGGTAGDAARFQLVDVLGSPITVTTVRASVGFETGDNLIVRNSVSNGSIILAPNGTGSVVLDGQNFPQAIGTAGQVLAVSGSPVTGDLIWVDAATGGGSGIDNVVEDTTPQLGGDLDVNGQSIVSVSNGDIAITPDGTGSVVLDGQNFPQAIGTAGQVLTVSGSPATNDLIWADAAEGGGGSGSASQLLTIKTVGGSPTSYTLELIDYEDRWIRFGGTQINVPSSNTVAFPTGAQVSVRVTSFETSLATVGSPTPTLNFGQGSPTNTFSVDDTIGLVYVGNDEWDII